MYCNTDFNTAKQVYEPKGPSKPHLAIWEGVVGQCLHAYSPTAVNTSTGECTFI